MIGVPGFKQKYGSKSMVSPDALLRYRKKQGRLSKITPPEGVIFCYDRGLMNYISRNHPFTRASVALNETLLLSETGNRIGVNGEFGIGAPVVVTVLEELIAFGVRKFISVGTAGALQKNLRIGDLIVCEKAIRDEGTSYHYLKPSKYSYASKNMTDRIIRSLEKQGKRYFRATSWTTDAPYRETIAEARRYQREGVATVEMEASALFAVAEYRDVEMGAIFTISDSLAGLAWEPKFHLTRLRSAKEALDNAAVDSLLN